MGDITATELRQASELSFSPTKTVALLRERDILDAENADLRKQLDRQTKIANSAKRILDDFTDTHKKVLASRSEVEAQLAKAVELLEEEHGHRMSWPLPCPPEPTTPPSPCETCELLATLTVEPETKVVCRYCGLETDDIIMDCVGCRRRICGRCVQTADSGEEFCQTCRPIYSPVEPETEK